MGTGYAATEREAVARCVTAALAEGAILYGVNGYAGTDGYAGYVGTYRRGAADVRGFPGIATTMKVTVITAVQRRSDGMRVKGLMLHSPRYHCINWFKLSLVIRQHHPAKVRNGCQAGLEKAPFVFRK